MRLNVTLFIVCACCLASCGPKPYYKTAEGKKKQKHYNSIQYGGRTTSEMKRP